MGVTQAAVAARVRPLGSEDRSQVVALLGALGDARTFTAEEIRTALELIDEWIDSGEGSGYLTYVIEEGGVVRGYVCYGPTPLTESTYDLYWIAVDPAIHGRGYGRLLMAFAETDIGRRGGRLVLIETSSHDANRSTIRFYEQAGYDLVARIRNFYRPGDDKLVFARELLPGAQVR
jgi:ribosomal protein S18 acetylase RimI-like enzyme